MQPGGPPDGGVPCAFGGGTVWVSPNGLVGDDHGEPGVCGSTSASPMPIQAFVVDAQNDGQKQLIVSDGRAAYLYLVEVVGSAPFDGQQGNPFVFDLETRGNGTGVGCEDLGDGRHLVALRLLAEICAARRSTSPRTRPYRAGPTRCPQPRRLDDHLRRQDDGQRRQVQQP